MDVEENLPEVDVESQDKKTFRRLLDDDALRKRAERISLLRDISSQRAAGTGSSETKKTTLTEDIIPGSGRHSSSWQHRRSPLLSATAAPRSAAVDRVNLSSSAVARNPAVHLTGRSDRMADASMNWRSKRAGDNRSAGYFGFTRKTDALSPPSAAAAPYTGAYTAASRVGRTGAYGYQNAVNPNRPPGRRSETDADTSQNWRSSRKSVDDSYNQAAVGFSKNRGKWQPQSTRERQPNSSGPRYRDKAEFAAPHERMKALSDESPEEALCGLTSKRSGFLTFFSYSQINDTRLVESMVAALNKACQSTYSPQSLSRLMQTINESGFLGGPLYHHFVNHVGELSASFVSAVVGILKSLLHRLPSSSLGNVTQLLSQLNLWKEQNGYEVAAVEDIQSAEEIMRDVTKQIKGGDLLRDQEKLAADEEQPPDDFRKIPTVPSAAEIKCDEPPFLRANIVYGAYKDVDHYLDVQYRLLREDFICPLREGLRTFHEYTDKNVPVNRISDIRFYRNVQILTPYCTLKGIMYRARFDVSQFARVRWESSKRLIFGSLVGLSKDNFETIIFGTVANRDPENLKKGEVDFSFEDDNASLIDPNPYTVYQMVECSAYFEAYRHVLQGLQEIESDGLPFKRHLLNQTSAKADVLVPRYLRDQNKSYDFTCLVKAGKRNLWESVPVLDLKEWPSARTLGLDDSQYSALKTAVTKEFVTIQGPPGTGKTFVGLKIVQLLLENCRRWDTDKSPILVVCYTNHALDQFLEGIIEICDLSGGELVRVGGRSSTENRRLLDCGIFNIKKGRDRMNMTHVQDAIIDTRDEMCHIQAEITRVVGEMEFARKSVIHEIHLQQFMTESQSRSLWSRRDQQDGTSVFRKWLRLDDSVQSDDRNPMPGNLEDGDEEIVEDDEEEVIRLQQERQVEENAPALSQRQQNLKSIREASLTIQHEMGVVGEDDLHVDDDDDDENPNEWQQTKSKRRHGTENACRIIHKRKHYQPMSELEWLAVDNVWTLSLRDRWRLYNCWASSFCEERSVLVRNLSAQYNRSCSHLTELNSEEDYQVLRQARVVGMTTTGAAKYRQLLQRVHPRIVIVEEAAEVMESHVVTTLSRRCDHLIMIGDHQQLRPNPTVYALAKKYHLDISLFERMVKNELHCDQLTIQHRMRPEIVKLIVPHVYKSLTNHESVLEYENIRGINGNLFFVAHSEVEKSVDDTKSKSNEHEATFLSCLTLYLLQQGYEPTQITVLTMYTGQMFLLRRLMPKRLFEGVRITPVDNYQGEENDIILLSLVRSNELGKIGFLQIHNRVCVALSRARKGLYVIGNMDQMADASSLWNGIIKELKANSQLVDALPLACQNHPDNITLAEKGEDFRKAPEGGCMLECGYRLLCGHVCTRKCHPTDRLHEKYVCRKPCAKILCEYGHQCSKRCFEECGRCQYMVEKTVPSCGHVQKMKCHVEPETFECQVPCAKVLACDHVCQEVCGRECTKECRIIVKERAWPCGHLLTVACHRNPDNFPCNFPTKRTLPCGHTVDARCSEDLTERKCFEKVNWKIFRVCIV